MEIKAYDLRLIPVLLIIWCISAWNVFANEIPDGDIGGVVASIIYGLLWFIIFILYNGPYYKYVIDEEGIRISCFRGELGFLPWKNIASVGISHWEKTEYALYISIFSPSQLEAHFKKYRCDPGYVKNKVCANYLLWRKGLNSLNENHPMLFLKGVSLKKCRRDLEQLLELNNRYAKKHNRPSVYISSFLK